MINLSSNHNDISHESFLSILYFSGFLLSLPSRLFKKLISFSLFNFNTINPLVLSVVYLDSWLPLFHLSLKCCKTKNYRRYYLRYVYTNNSFIIPPRFSLSRYPHNTFNLNSINFKPFGNPIDILYLDYYSYYRVVYQPF